MKTLKNRISLTEDQREEIIYMACGEDGKYTFASLRLWLNKMYKTIEETGNKPSYSYKDAMYQSFSDRQDNYKRTGRY